jgi:hypothetical protein
MRTAVGVFSSRASAEYAVERLRPLGIPDNHIHLLIPRASQEQLYEVPTTDAVGNIVSHALTEGLPKDEEPA